MTPVLTVGIDLVEESGALEAEVFHFLSSPQEAPSCVSALLDSRKKAGILKRPLIIWEPAPPFCRSEYLAACLEAARWVDVFSPNHFELLALWGKSPPSILDKFQIESLAGKFIDSGVGPDGMGTVIIRAGEHGSMISLRGFLPKWLPPCYPSTPDGRQHPKVVDPTGAGNAFLGAYGIGLLITSDPVKAACYGSVGASFALEQVSVPKLAQDEDTELWNGTDVFARLGTYIKKLDPADLQNHFSPRYTA